MFLDCSSRVSRYGRCDRLCNGIAIMCRIGEIVLHFGGLRPASTEWLIELRVKRTLMARSASSRIASVTGSLARPSRSNQIIAFRTMVSLAPVMRAGFLTSVLYALTGKLIPEIGVIMDVNRASANLDCDSRVRRMVVWSKFDESLRSVDLTQIENIETRRVMATHFSIAWQPNVRRIVREFMFPEMS